MRDIDGDPETASFRLRFKPRDVRGVTVIVVDEPLGDEGHALLQRGVQQIIRASGQRGFVCDVGALEATLPGFDGDESQLELAVRCYTTLSRAGATFCFLNCHAYERISVQFTDRWPLLGKMFGGPRRGFFLHEAKAVDYVLQELQ